MERWPTAEHQAPDRVRHPDAQANVEDWTGGGDHFRATVVSARFIGKVAHRAHRMSTRYFGDETVAPSTPCPDHEGRVR